MKRILTLGFLPLVLGLAGAWLRAYELAYVFDPVTGLPSNPMAVTPVLIGLTLAGAAIFIAAALLYRPKEPHGKPGPMFLAASSVAFAVLFGFAGYLFYQCTKAFTITQLIFGLLTLYCAAAVLTLGVKRLDGSPSSVYSVMAVAPVFWACYALILIFRERISDPIILDYIYLLFAFICILLFSYCQAGYVFGRNKQRLAIVTAAMGVYFCVVELIAPVVAGFLSPGAELMKVSLEEALPLAAFLVYMPFALQEMLHNRNRVGLDAAPKASEQ